MFELSMYPYKKLFHGYKKTKITLQVTKYPYLKWQCIFSFYLVFVFYISPTRLLYITDKTFIYHRQDFYISPTRLYYRQDFYISPTRLYYRQDFYISPTRFLSDLTIYMSNTADVFYEEVTAYSLRASGFIPRFWWSPGGIHGGGAPP
jgi:hypothetical protein